MPSNLAQIGTKSKILASVTLKFAGWPKKNIGNLFLAPVSYVRYFVAII